MALLYVALVRCTEAKGSPFVQSVSLPSFPHSHSGSGEPSSQSWSVEWRQQCLHVLGLGGGGLAIIDPFSLALLAHLGLVVAQWLDSRLEGCISTLGPRGLGVRALGVSLGQGHRYVSHFLSFFF